VSPYARRLAADQCTGMTGMELPFLRVRATVHPRARATPGPGSTGPRRARDLRDRTGVGEDHVERRAVLVISRDECSDIDPDDHGQVAQSRPTKVLTDRRERRAVPLDQDDLPGAPRERLHPQGAAARVEVRTLAPTTVCPRLEKSPSRAMSETGRTPFGTGASRIPSPSRDDPHPWNSQSIERSNRSAARRGGQGARTGPGRRRRCRTRVPGRASRGPGPRPGARASGPACPTAARRRACPHRAGEGPGRRA